MIDFSPKCLPKSRTSVAPEGSEVRTLLSLKGGSMAHFELAPGQTSRAAAHRTVEEIWFFLNSRGEIWRKQGCLEEVVQVEGGVCQFTLRSLPAQYFSFTTLRAIFPFGFLGSSATKSTDCGFL